jgi:alcohol dehydrogenase (cytochrome c)
MALKNALTLAVSALCMISSPNRLVAQGVNESILLHPPADSWPGYHGDYSGKRHSSLAQITSQNVHELSLAWAFQTDQPASIKASPLLVDGIIYLTAIDNVWAVDARTGRSIWRYIYPPNKGGTIGQRGVAMYHDSLYYLSPDAHLVCLNAKDGKPRWKVEVADSEKGYWSTAAPVIVGNHVTSRVFSSRWIPAPERCSGNGTLLRLPAHRMPQPAA